MDKAVSSVGAARKNGVYIMFPSYEYEGHVDPPVFLSREDIDRRA